MERYLPSCGTEGADFMCEWCSHCARDKPLSEGKDFDACAPNEVCDILARSFSGEVDEWIYGDDGVPKCTAFLPVGERPQERCTNTPDMFTPALHPYQEGR